MSMVVLVINKITLHQITEENRCIRFILKTIKFNMIKNPTRIKGLVMNPTKQTLNIMM